ncbi:Protein of unknown function [Bacillus cytotoxicus]|nr:Protein of unknown function [Bacillus cytotoxicus]
MDTNKSNG